MKNDILFCTAERRHIPQLKALWRVCFPDDRPTDIDHFYDTLFSSMICLIGIADEQPVTMLHLLPAHAYVRTVAYPVRYLYAGATHPEHRKRGYYAALLHYSQKFVEGIGEYGIYLHPATDGLIQLYTGAGYTETIVSGVPQPLSGGEALLSLSPEDYARLRQDCIRKLNCDVVYFEPSLTISELFISGLFCEGIKLYRKDGRILMVKNDITIDSLPPVTTGAYQTAMWLQTKAEHTLNQVMQAFGGYTALLGE